jgi:myosin heavy subunit
VDASEFHLGKTKVFIRSAKTLFLLEEARAREMPKVAVMMQKVWKGHKTRVWFKKEVRVFKFTRFRLEDGFRGFF